MDELTQKEMATLLAVYREQTLYLLDEMTADLLALEAGSADHEALTRLRRAAHTIKGDSVCVMLEGVAEIAHRIEDLMADVMARGGDFDRGAVDAMLGGLDLLRHAIDREAVEDVAADAVQQWIDDLSVEGDDRHELQTFRPPDAPTGHRERQARRAGDARRRDRA